jgi:hypothetical protein
LTAQAQPSARAAVYFGGAPVVGSRGIDATFASKAIANDEDFVTKVWGQRQHGILPASGPVRDRHEARLHITGVVRGRSASSWPSSRGRPRSRVRPCAMP